MIIAIILSPAEDAADASISVGKGKKKGRLCLGLELKKLKREYQVGCARFLIDTPTPIVDSRKNFYYSFSCFSFFIFRE